MPNSKNDRAKQFLPFDALKGLQDALREKEKEYEEKKELSEESYKELQNEFNKIEIGKIAKIRYYKDKNYTDIIGKITNIDYIKKKIQINEVENINISDIVEIKRVYYDGGLNVTYSKVNEYIYLK